MQRTHPASYVWSPARYAQLHCVNECQPYQMPKPILQSTQAWWGMKQKGQLGLTWQSSKDLNSNRWLVVNMLSSNQYFRNSTSAANAASELRMITRQIRSTAPSVCLHIPQPYRHEASEERKLERYVQRQPAVERDHQDNAESNIHPTYHSQMVNDTIITATKHTEQILDNQWRRWRYDGTVAKDAE